MPYTISGKVLDIEGFPLNHIAVVKEIPASGNLGIADVWTDPDTGFFAISAINSASTIEISAVGYKTKTFPANAVPAEIRLDSALTIVGNTAPEKDNTLLYIGAGVLVIAAIVALTSKKATRKAPVKQIGLANSKPAIKAKTYIV